MQNKFAIIISVEKYRDKKIHPVSYASNDANELYNSLLAIGYNPANVKLLINDSATKTLMENALKSIFKSLSINDELLIFYAGHGFTKNNHNYITCYDTVYSDLIDTSIILQNIFNQVRSSHSKKVIFLLDTCHSGLEIDDSMRDIISDFTPDELEEFFKKAEYYIAFASCKSDEVSHSASALSHGIWSYHLLQVLSGEVPKLLKKGHIISASDLQNYFSIEVPKTAKTYTTKGYQNPVMFGNLSQDFIVFDLIKVIEEKKKKKNGFFICRN